MEVGVADAAARLAVSERRVRQLAESGALVARQVSGRWLIDEASLDRAVPVARPMSGRMSWALIAQLSSGLAEGPNNQYWPNDRIGGSELARLREKADRLHHSERPADLLRAWLRKRAERLPFRAAAADLPDLAADPRLAPSGISDKRAGLSAAGECEGYVAQADLEVLRRDYLLVESSQPNVILHVADRPVPRPAPLALVLADLADWHGAREDAQVRRLLHEVQPS
jgi:hypothetical protein